MIGGVIILLVAVWFYQTAIKTKNSNAFLWVAIGAITFFAAQYFLVNLNVYILDAIKESKSAGMLPGRDLASIGDRVTQDNRGGASGFLLSAFFELMPPIGGLIAAALVRTLALLREKPTPTNLISGFGEMIMGILVSIKDSVKTAEK